MSCKIGIPPLLEKLLTFIISSTKEKTERKTRLVSSIAQDLIYATSGGEKKTLKQVQLGLCIKRTTGSRKVIQWSNRFGHSISYKEINIVKTHVAEEQTRIQDDRTYVPNNIQPDTMITFVYDSCDHNTESIQGSTMHATNEIVIQLKSEQMRQFDEPESTTLTRQKRNSFKPFYGRELMPNVKSKNKGNPQTLGDITSNCNELVRMLANRDNKLWYFSSYEYITHDHNTSEQKLPPWKGYHHLVPPQNHNDSFAVGFLSSTNDSPTKYGVVREILLQCKAKAEALNLNVADLVLDHAIYSKTLEILMKKGNESLKDFINLRMGGFHACCIFLYIVSLANALQMPA